MNFFGIRSPQLIKKEINFNLPGSITLYLEIHSNITVYKIKTCAAAVLLQFIKSAAASQNRL